MPSDRINGVQLHHEIEGAGQTVVLTHGSWGDGASWQPTVDVLKDSYRVVTWDRRGHSRSEDSVGAGSVEEDIADLSALIEHVADQPVHAVGNSYGSVLTYGLAASRPDLVASAAVHEPAALTLLEETALVDPDVGRVATPVFHELDIVKLLLEEPTGIIGRLLRQSLGPCVIR